MMTQTVPFSISWMDEWLFLFSAELFFIPFKINEFERETAVRVGKRVMVKWPLKPEVSASPMIWKSIHRGTEVKANTYLAMQIVFVIIDI